MGGMGIGGAGGGGLPVVDADRGSIESFGGVSKDLGTIKISDDGTENQALYEFEVALDGDDESNFNDREIFAYGFTCCIVPKVDGGGGPPPDPDLAAYEDCVVKRGTFQLIQGGQGGEKVISVAPLSTLAMNSKFPRGGLQQRVIPMPGNWQATRFRVALRDLPIAESGWEFFLTCELLIYFDYPEDCPEGPESDFDLNRYTPNPVRSLEEHERAKLDREKASRPRGPIVLHPKAPSERSSGARLPKLGLAKIKL